MPFMSCHMSKYTTGGHARFWFKLTKGSTYEGTLRWGTQLDWGQRGVGQFHWGAGVIHGRTERRTKRESEGHILTCYTAIYFCALSHCNSVSHSYTFIPTHICRLTDLYYHHHHHHHIGAHIQTREPESLCHALGKACKETILFTLFGSTSIKVLNEIWEWVSCENTTTEVMVPWINF